MAKSVELTCAAQGNNSCWMAAVKIVKSIRKSHQMESNVKVQHVQIDKELMKMENAKIVMSMKGNEKMAKLVDLMPVLPDKSFWPMVNVSIVMIILSFRRIKEIAKHLNAKHGRKFRKMDLVRRARTSKSHQRTKRHVFNKNVKLDR